MSTLSQRQSLSVPLQFILPVCGFALLTAVCAHLRFYLPGTPVPVTLQSFAVVLAGASLGAWRGLASQALLIFFGALGYSVFSTRAVGVEVLLGSTGGYIFGFLLTSFVAGSLKDRGRLQTFWGTTLWLFVSSFFIFIPGVVWLKVFTQISWADAVSQGLLPFLIGDVVKTFAASGIVFSTQFFRR